MTPSTDEASPDEAATNESADTPAPGYAAAVEELEIILGELDDDDIDIDVLSTKVERAADLIRFCRGRIRDAEMKVTEIVADLADLEESSSDLAADPS